MKSTFILLACLAFQISFAQITSLTSQESTSDANLRGLWVLNENEIWASGSKGTILKTENGGQRWSKIIVKGFEDKDFRDIVAFSSQKAIIINAGSPAYVLKTTDGGQNWKVVYQDTSKTAFLDDIGFLDEQNGFVFGDPDAEGYFTLLQTNDAGESWQNIGKRLPKAQKNEAGFAASGTIMRFKSPHIWIGTGGGEVSRVLFSPDKGETWQYTTTPILAGKNTQGIFSMAFKDKKRGLAVGGDYTQAQSPEKTAIYTQDAGKTWKLAKTMPKGYRSSVAFVNKNTYVCVGTNGIDFTKNNGKNWVNISSEGFNTIRFAPNTKTAWLVGNKGKIAKLLIR
ncbi:MAG: oxidoreductase [Raineya sp.]